MSFIKRIFTWWHGSTFGTNLQIRRKTTKVGEDDYGNSYFEENKVGYEGRKRRFVTYTGYADASRVPPLWNGWLHHTIDTPPSDEDVRHDWQKDYEPNLTGTLHAYKPKGSLERGGVRDAVASDYQAWTPNG